MIKKVTNGYKKLSVATQQLITALGTVLLKLGKSAVSSKIGSMVKNTTAPSWMEALIAKVIKEGTDIPIPKQPGSAAEKISIKELEFKNPETGQMEKVQLK